MAAAADYVFYSWQSDLPGNYNRNFIEGAIEAALKQLNARTNIESAARASWPSTRTQKASRGRPE